MTVFNRLKIGPAAFVVALSLPVLVNGCSDNPAAALCCTDFKVGADMSGTDFGVDASIKGQFAVFAQASGDFSAVATSTLDEIAVSCKNIAIDLGADQASLDAAAAQTGRDAVVKSDPAKPKGYCDLAVDQINASFGASSKFAAAGSLSINFVPPACSASISANANCQAKCSVDGKCDIKAHPPKCTGSLEISCQGSCSGSAGASVKCEGECSGTCDGSCTAEGGVAVDCNGKCEGTCQGSTDSGGNCNGKCQGTCTASATAPKLQCSGTCSGKCSATCSAKANASVKCDGTCTGNATPISCTGGKLEGGCQVDADCNANCDASVSAKAECTPPSVSITASASASLSADVQGQFNTVIHSLEVNLPNILVAFKARGQAFVDIGTAVGTAAVHISANPGKLNVKGGACAVAIAGVLGEAASNIKTSVTAAGSVAGALKLN